MRLTGKTHGKNLTLFQSIGLAVYGVCFVLGVGIPMIVGESVLQSNFERIELSYAKDFRSILLGILFCILGTAWMIMGLIGVDQQHGNQNKRSR